MPFSEDKKYLRVNFSIIQRAVHGADLFGVVEEFPFVDFSDINEFLESLIEDGCISLNGGRLKLTDLGLTYLKNLNKQLGNNGIYRYILPSSSAFCQSQNIDTPYIPGKRHR